MIESQKGVIATLLKIQCVPMKRKPEISVTGEASPSIYADWVNGGWFWKPNNKSLGKFGQSNQEIWLFKGFINFVYVALSGGTLLISMMSQQYNCLMELYIHTFLQNFTFHENCIFPLLLLRYVRAEMNVHAFMNELDQKDLISKKN